MSGVSPGQKAASAIQSATSLSWPTTLIVLMALGGSIFLTWADKLDGQAFVAIASMIVGGVLALRGVTSGSAASSAPPPPES